MQKLLIIGMVWPEPTSSAAGWRMMQLIDLFAKANYQLHFACAASKSAHSQDFESIPIQEHSIALNDPSFDRFIADLCPDIVVFDRFMIEEQFGWRVRQQVPNAMTILDTEDLHFLRKARAISYKKDKPIDLYTDDAKRELACILRCDLSLIISREEVQLLVERFHIPPDLLYYLPFLEKRLDEATKAEWTAFDDRKDFLFIGNFLHEPNWQTILVLKKVVWPIIRQKLPDAQLHIYGAYASQKVYDLENKKEKFIIMDRAKDARTTMQQYKLLLAPIPFGAGAKGKFIDAMMSGTPAVTTTVGAESMSTNQLWNGAIEDNLNAFAQKASDLYLNEKEWIAAQCNGIKIINDEYCIDDFSDVFGNKIRSIHSSLEKHRNQHFITQIMNHHLAQSSKYLSLWIQEKNKKE